MDRRSSAALRRLHALCGGGAGMALDGDGECSDQADAQTTASDSLPATTIVASLGASTSAASAISLPAEDLALQALQRDWCTPTVLASYNPNVAMARQKPIAAAPSPRRHHDATALAVYKPLQGSVAEPAQPQPRNAASAASRSDGPAVGERLQRYHVEYEARRAEKRALQEELQLQALRSPTLNKKSLAITCGRSSGASATLQRLAAPRSAGTRSTFAGVGAVPIVDFGSSPEQVRDGQARDRSGTPTINERSRALGQRGVELQFAWDAQRRQRLQQMKLQQEQKALEQAPGTPTLDRASRLMAARSQLLVNGAVDAQRVEVRLLARAHKQELRDIAAAELAPERARATMTLPRATIAAAADRLYKEAEQRDLRAKRSAMRQELLEEVDERTGQVLFQPCVDRRDGDGVEESCREAADDCSSTRKTFSRGTAERLAAPRERESQRVGGKAARESEATPQISTFSRLLVDLRNGGCAEPSSAVVARLAQPKSHKQHEEPQPHELSPALNKRSKAPVAASPPASTSRGHIVRLMEQQAHYDMHRERLAREKVEREEAELQAMQRRTAAAATTEGAAQFFTRQLMWCAKKEVKLEKERGNKATAAVAGCTFTPVTTKPPVMSSAAHMSTETRTRLLFGNDTPDVPKVRVSLAQ